VFTQTSSLRTSTGKVGALSAHKSKVQPPPEAVDRILRQRANAASPPPAPAPAAQPPAPVADAISAGDVLRQIMEPVTEAINSLVDRVDELRKESLSLRTALAELKAEHAEVKTQFGVAAHKLERLTITHKGDPGERGPQGVDGREGRPGAQGAKGSRGQKGYTVCGWEIDAVNYRAIPEFDDGTMGPALCLRAMFEQFDAETGGDDIDAAIEETALQRTRLELEIERTRRGWPAK